MEFINKTNYTCEETIENSISAGVLTKKKTAFTSSICFISAICGFISYGIEEDKSKTTFLVLGVCLTFFGFFFIFSHINALRALRKNNQKQFSNGLTYIYTFNKHGFKVTIKYNGNEASSKLNFSNILKVKESSHSYYLFVNKVNFYPIKKDGFENDEDFNFFYKKIEKLIKKKKKSSK